MNIYNIKYENGENHNGSIQISAPSPEKAIANFDFLWELEIRRKVEGLGIAEIVEIKRVRKDK